MIIKIFPYLKEGSNQTNNNGGEKEGVEYILGLLEYIVALKNWVSSPDICCCLQ